jgi:hypothetical protein
MFFSLLKIVGEVIVSFVACMATGTFFDQMDWPLFHLWGLMHGSIFLLFPVYFSLVHLLGKQLENLWEPGASSTRTLSSYIHNNWKSFAALFLGFIGFMIPFLSIGGLVLGLQARKLHREGVSIVDNGLATASVVASLLGVAFVLYFAFTMLYINYFTSFN